MTYPATWATIANVSLLTGLTVAQSVVDQAEADIEMATGLFSDPTLSPGVVTLPRDLEWLKRAVAYQSAWLSSQPDAFQRSEVSELVQDGVQVNFEGHSITLAPRALRALKRVSWRGTRSISVGAQGDKRLRSANYVDDSLPWGGIDGDSPHTSSQEWAGFGE